jgi:hypothetical protein
MAERAGAERKTFFQNKMKEKNSKALRRRKYGDRKDGQGGNFWRWLQ